MRFKKEIEQVRDEIRQRMSGEGSGHDWWHVWRVYQTALRIGRKEKVDMNVVELAALLHDVADWKDHGGDTEAGPREAREVMAKCGISDGALVDHVCDIISKMSFKGAGVAETTLTREGQVVRDADRLDAMGAIGIARAFAFGGTRGRPLHEPGTKPTAHTDPQEYVRAKGTTVNHFHEKLLLLRDRMHTDEGRVIAAERHTYMVLFLERFMAEWYGME